MKLAEFLTTVVTGGEGYFCLGLLPPSGVGWQEKWFNWPADKDAIIEMAFALAPEYNVYFSSYLFDTRSTARTHALPSRTIQADLDEADVTTLPIPPTILVQTSPERHQGYWILDEEVDLGIHEILSRKLTYSIDRCDHSGWPIGRKVRVPFTLNHKYLEGPYTVEIAATAGGKVTASQLELLPEAEPQHAEIEAEGFLEAAPDVTIAVGPQELLNSIKSKLPAKVVQQYNVRQDDRSAALWALSCAGFRAGLSREEVYWLAKHSANNKFADLKYHSDRELGKDVLRAERTARQKVADPRALVLEARKLPGQAMVRRNYLFRIVLSCMKGEGEFVRTSDDTGWYIRRDIGRPIQLSVRSDYLNMILDMRFGLNSSEADHNYVVHGLDSFQRSLPVTATLAALSHYDATNRALLLHTGRKDVLRITADEIAKSTDGSYGVVFPWPASIDPIVPSLMPLPKNQNWSDVLFGQHVKNIVALKPAESLSLLRVWLLFCLFRNTSVSRPILALFGSPGSGKCLAPDTEVLMYNGSKKYAGEVTVHDLLMGDDFSPRRVLATTTGEDEMYLITPVRGTPFACNGAHMLTLADTTVLGELTRDVAVEDFLHEPESPRSRWMLFRRLAPESPLHMVGFDIEPVGRGPYAGFELDGNGRFMLGDCTVTHNSTLFRKVYALLYGGARSLNAVSTADDYDTAVASDPLVVLDNVDTWERWLPDRLALAASTSDRVKRKLYTDVDAVVMKRQAVVALTAHDPKFGREDVMDRLLVLMMERLPHFIPEGEMIRNVLQWRGSLWSSIIADVQSTLATNMPNDNDIPQFRVEDFARVGYWIASALNIGDEFKSALVHVQSTQKANLLEEDSMLVSALTHFLLSRQNGHTDNRWFTAGTLWIALESLADDDVAFSRTYRNPVRLGRKLWNMHEALKSVFDLECKYDSAKGTRVWKFNKT